MKRHGLMHRWVSRALALLMITAPLSLTSCSTNPATGKMQFNILSESEEIQIGNEAAPEFLARGGGPIPSREIQKYVEDLGFRIVAVSERPDLPWEFHTLDSEIINAFALPGGKVFITRGLMSRMENEAQLVGVLGHEVGHVTAQHIGQQMSQRMAIGIGIAAIGIGAQFSDEDWIELLGIGAAVGGSLYALSYGRGQESEADVLGVRYMTRLKYDPRGQVQVMEILRDASGGSGGVEFLQTHPNPQRRINDLNKLIREKYPDIENSNRFKFNPDRFDRIVLQNLKDLPPAKQQANSGERLLTDELVAKYEVIGCTSGACSHEHHHGHDHDHHEHHVH